MASRRRLAAHSRAGQNRGTVDLLPDFSYENEYFARPPTGSATVTKADIIESVYEKVGFSKKEAAEIVEMVFDTIKETLERGEKIKISGFGNFLVRDKKSRVGRNPQTGEEIEISARRVLTFRPSQVLKNALNSADMPNAPASSTPMAQ
jgi:integration host factor subunit alpha